MDKTKSPTVEKTHKAPAKVTTRLFPATLKLLMHADFHQVQIRDVAAESGVSSATIYKYFGSKEGLVISILEDFLNSISKKVQSVAESDNDTLTKFRMIWAQTMQAYDENPAIAVVYFITVPTRTWIFHDSWQLDEIAKSIGAIVEEGRKLGEIDPDISDTQIIGLFYALVGREVEIWYHNGMKWPLISRSDQVFKLFWKTVRIPNPAM
ncbi:TetR/AcrR family transcriptional regulator [Lutimaribacter marinistellae]|uniref:TetR/AcrR family transcriptional regulator n=1 Tax=Lutimaribacter marinistellae TaxID=1820329 RepID=A0ABV7TDH2_9RHOB